MYVALLLCCIFICINVSEVVPAYNKKGFVVAINNGDYSHPICSKMYVNLLLKDMNYGLRKYCVAS